MAASTQQVSEFDIVQNSNTSITPHQIYTACKPFGFIVECIDAYDNLRIKLDRSILTVRLKPMHILRIGHEIVVLKWLHNGDRDNLPIVPLQQLPELHSSQQSPQNILDVLNDDCLREIFVNLTELDRCAVAHVCQRFRDVVLGIKPKHIQITNRTGPLWKIEKFLRIFGKSIRTAHITECPCPNIVLVLLTKYCENLVEVVECGYYLRNTTLNEVAALFPRLRRVHLSHHGTADIVFQPNDEIESIRVGHVAHLPPIHFPKLRELQFRIENVDIPSIQQFFALNPQIEIFELECWADFPLSQFLGNLPRLQVLRINWSDLSTDDISALCHATSLQTLEFTDIDGDVAPMLRAFVENGIRLKRLKLVVQSIPYRHAIDLLIQMKSLEYLIIDCVNDDELVRLIRNLTSLKKIEIESDEMTPRGIRDALRCANNLENAKFRIIVFDDHMIVDQSNVIDEIGEMRAKKLINIQALISWSNIKTGDSDEQAIDNILDRHSAWLNDNYY